LSHTPFLNCVTRKTYLEHQKRILTVTLATQFPPGSNHIEISPKVPIQSITYTFFAFHN